MEELPSLFLILGLILLNGTFVAAEFSIARIRKSQVVNMLADESTSKKVKRAAVLLDTIVNNINDYISACQVGITIISLVLGAVAESKVEKMIQPYVSMLMPNLDSHFISISITLVMITFLHVLIGELVPKNLSLLDPEATGVRLANFLRISHALFIFPVKILNFFSDLCMRVLGVENRNKTFTHSEDELRIILSNSQEEGVIEEEEEKLIQNVFEFNDTVAKDVMTPRTDVIFLESSVTVAEAAQLTNQYSFSKFPVIDKRLDNIIGFVHIKGILRAIGQGKEGSLLSEIVLECLKVPDGMFIIDLLEEMQAKKKQLAILMDEYGGTSGMVTVEDIVEEVFGEISSEFETSTDNAITKVNDNEYIFDGTLPLREVNDVLDSTLNSEHYDTIGGFVYGLLGSEARNDAHIDYANFTFIIEKYTKNRVRQVKVITHHVEELEV